MPKILIADDSRFQVQALTSWLSPKGFEVITALDAIQAWMSALRASPDLILLDINMPAGNGLEILKRLRNSPKTQRIPVIVITGDEDPTTESQARKLGATEFLRKPVEQDQVCAAVDRALAPEARKAEP
jgi:CheY-like chemotaxis protein